MVIEKVLNNNMVISRNPEGKEIILQGKGIGFNKRKRDSIVSTQVERIFTPNDKNEIKRFQDFFAKLPDEYWEIAEQMTHYAREVCELKVSERVLIPVCDHLAGAVERYQSGAVLKNPMLWEVKHLYPKEYQVGCRGLELVKKRFHIQMEPDEAAFLAFHYVCSQLGDSQVENLEAITRLIKEITQIVEDEWFHLIKEKYPQSYKCIVKIADFIHDVYHYELNREEMLYLMIHIEKITRQ